MLDEVAREFLVEGAETLDRIEADLVALERDPDAAGRVARIFRGLHTIKGNCGFLAFPRLESLSHAGEDVLSRVRDGTLPPDGPVVTALLHLVDVMRRVLAGIEREGVEPAGDDAEAMAGLRRAARRVKPAGAAGADDRRRPAERRRGDARRAAAMPEASVRVDVVALDRLRDLAGDLTAARDEILRFAPPRADSAWDRAASRLHRATIQLHDAVAAARMQPIGTIWTRFPRVVRDLAAQAGKQVELRMDGHETSLDRAILEAIRDPLVHALRNAVAHGIERPELRRRAGKPPEGLVWLRAERQGDRLDVAIADDGAGIDPSVVRRVAVRRGFVSSRTAAGLSDHEIVALVFQPGLTTAERVTKASGRGVGMDVLRTNVQRIGGRVEIQSRVGRGTTIRITIPLSPAAGVAAPVAETAGAR